MEKGKSRGKWKGQGGGQRGGRGGGGRGPGNFNRSFGGRDGTTPVDKSTITCFNCQKTGHMKSQCWLPGGGDEGGGPRGRGSGRVRGGSRSSFSSRTECQNTGTSGNSDYGTKYTGGYDNNYSNSANTGGSGTRSLMGGR